MGNAPVKRIKKGKINCAVFKNDFQGKVTYSYKFQKSYMDKDKNWQNTDNFYSGDLRDLEILIREINNKLVKFEDIKPQSEPEPESQEQPEDLPF